MSSPDRVHLISHAGSALKDIKRFGFSNGSELLDLIRANLPAPLRLTGSPRFLEHPDEEYKGGRSDDAARIRDLQDALDDPRTSAIVAANGGAYFSRILPHLDFSRLARRRAPLWAFGFSEMTTLVNIIAGYRCGRGVYWLCPNYLAWKVQPVAAARAAYADFWRGIPEMTTEPGRFIVPLQVAGELVAGSVQTGSVRLIGGCISVVTPLLAGPLAKRLNPTGRWLAIEDVNEAPYRVDRHLAALKMAGWFDRVAGVLVGDFRTGEIDQSPAVVQMLKYHLPPKRELPVVLTHSFGHVWPMSPLPLNRPLRLTRRGSTVTISAA